MIQSFFQSATAMLHRYCLCFLLALSLVSAPPLLAQDKLTMNMRDADIRALIQWVADNTGKSIVVHKDVQGKVTVLSPQPVTPDEAYQVFLSVLQVHGYAAIESGKALKIVPANIATKSGVSSSASQHQDMVVSVIKANHLSAEKLAQSLKPLLSENALLAPNASSNSLIVADHATNIQQIKSLISELDAASAQPIEVVRLQHANAEDVLAALQGLLPEKAEGDAIIGLSIDERSNSVLLSGVDSRRQQIKRLIKQLDTPLSGSGNTQVVYLHYIDAAEVAPILKSLAKTMEDEQKSGSMAISVEASESANALVLKAPPAILNSMKSVIKQLDIRRAQVLIESLIVEVSGDVGEDLGVNWVTTDLNENDSGIAAGVSTLGNLQLGSVTTGLGSGFTFGYFEGGNIQAAIRALDTNQKTNILSTPTVVALDNEEAALLVGQNVPFITGSFTTPSDDSQNPFTTIERKDIGITLEVTPRINQGDSITMDIKQTTENIRAATSSLRLEGASDIITNKREILTTALVKNDQILVLGGLISDDEKETEQKVPLLGDIPLLGKLFKSTSKTRERKNLMVFIHPVILKDEQQSTSLTQRRYNFMRDLQKESRKRPVNIGKQQPMIEEFDTFTPVNK